MKTVTVTMYVANDGTEFKTEEGCVAYEKYMERSEKFRTLLVKNVNASISEEDINRIYAALVYNAKEAIGLLTELHELNYEMAGMEKP